VNSDDDFAISPQVLAAVVRIATHRIPFRNRYRLEEVLRFCNVILNAPGCKIVNPAVAHWGIFCELCQATGAHGNLVPDAWFAALAIEHGCEWITHDRDYARFPGLRWRPPF